MKHKFRYLPEEDIFSFRRKLQTELAILKCIDFSFFYEGKLHLSDKTYLHNGNQ